MRHLLRLAAAALFAVLLSATQTFAATTSAQLVELSRAGLSDDILIALIQTDGSVFHLSATDILALHRAGLSDRVILAMTETARRPAPRPAPEPVAEPVPVPPPAPPTVVNVTQNVTQRVEAPRSYDYPRYATPIYLPAPIVTPRSEPPVYWGFGGQRRPDSWDDGNNRKPEEPKPADKKKQ